MKTDLQLKSDVADELAWDPSINATNIGVAVKDGVVTLSGHLDTFAEKHAAERAVRRVAGVRGIALDLDVKLAPGHQRSDSEIAQAATAALHLNSLVPDGKVKVEVEDGWITLTGEVDWRYQFASAEQCIRPLTGVRGLFNQITIKPRVKGDDITRADRGRAHAPGRARSQAHRDRSRRRRRHAERQGALDGRARRRHRRGLLGARRLARHRPPAGRRLKRHFIPRRSS